MKLRYSSAMVVLVLAIVSGGLVAATPGDAGAVGNMHLGPFGIHPYANVSIDYSDNVTRVPNNEESDTSVDLIGGLLVETPRDDRKLKAFYEIRAEDYFDNDFNCRVPAAGRPNCSQNAVNHRAEIFARFKLGSGLILDGGYNYARTHDDRGSNLFIPGPDIVMVDPHLSFFHDNTIKGGIGYEFADRYRIKIDGAYQDIDYVREDDVFRDHDAVKIAGTFYYRFQPKTSGLLEIDWIDTNFDKNNDLDGNEIHYLLGITWAYEDKSSGTVKAGYGKKEFDDSEQPDFEGFVFSISVDHHFSTWTSLQIEGVRQIHETNFIPANYLDTTTVDVSLIHMFTGKTGAVGHVGYIREDYSQGFVRIIHGETVEEDFLNETWKLGIDLTYDMRDWIGFRAGYLFRTRSSDFPDLEYDENRFFFSIRTML